MFKLTITGTTLAGILALVPGCTTFDGLEVGAGAGAGATQSTCKNGVRDTGELGIDCGGTCTKACDGATCVDGSGCSSGTCTGGTCAPSASKTCGVGLPNACADGQKCGVDADCTSDYCSANGACSAPGGDVHTDGRRDGGETGKDCGGGTAPACAAGETCKVASDCEGICNAGGTCDAPSPTDGKKDGDETDVDCGGATAPKCLLGKACGTNADCGLDACTGNVCVTPTASDGVKNGSETDVDCGGAGVSGEGVTYQAPRCGVDKACAAGTDCLTTACSPGKKCAVPSCATAEVAGITSCGTGETGQNGAVHESCCNSLVLPTRTSRRLDKYEITSGRYRSFLTSTGANLRAWATQYVTDHPGSQLAQMLAGWPALKTILPQADMDGEISLNALLSLDLDNYNGIRGCYNANGNYSANTYWQDKAHQTNAGLPERLLPRTISDEKSLNCQMPIMLATFCAWDGGELAMAADYADVWPTAQSFPWGNTNYCTEGGGNGVPGAYKPCDAYNWCNGPYENGGFKCQNTGTYTALDEAGMFYEYPEGTDHSIDNEPLIASPGRFPKDLTAAKSANGEGWFDLFANLAEYTGDFASTNNATYQTFCNLTNPPGAGDTACTRKVGNDGPTQTGTAHGGIPVVGMVGSTWEGHQYGPYSKEAIPATFQYGKFGARCVRPAGAY